MFACGAVIFVAGFVAGDACWAFFAVSRSASTRPARDCTIAGLTLPLESAFPASLAIRSDGGFTGLIFLAMDCSCFLGLLKLESCADSGRQRAGRWGSPRYPQGMPTECEPGVSALAQMRKDFAETGIVLAWYKSFEMYRSQSPGVLRARCVRDVCNLAGAGA